MRGWKEASAFRATVAFSSSCLHHGGNVADTASYSRTSLETCAGIGSVNRSAMSLVPSSSPEARLCLLLDSR